MFGFFRIADFFGLTSIHGCAHFNKPSLWHKFIYLCIVLGATIFCVWEIRSTVSNYIDYNVAITKRTTVNKEVQFPAVTICPNFGYNKMVVGGSPRLFVSAYIASMPPFPKSVEIPAKLCGVAGLKEIVLPSPGKPPAEYPAFTYFLKSAMPNSISAVVGCELKNVKVDCTEWFFNKFTDSGLCFTLNQDPAVIDTYPQRLTPNGTAFGSTIPNGITIKTGGPRDGIKITMVSNQTQNCIPTTYDGAGFTAAVHDRDTEPAMALKRLVDLPPGFVINVGIRISQVKRNTLDWPTLRCYDRYPMVFYPNNKYYRSSDSWRKNCVVKTMWDRCGAIPFYAPPQASVVVRNWTGISPSADFAYLLCAYNITIQQCCWDVERSAFFNEICAANVNMPLPCSESRYDTFVTSSKYPTAAEFAALKRDVNKWKNATVDYTFKQFRQNFLSANFYIISKNTQKIEINPGMTWVGLMNCMGGALGMSLGISLLSLCEISSWLIMRFFEGLLSGFINKIFDTEKLRLHYYHQ